MDSHNLNRVKEGGVALSPISVRLALSSGDHDVDQLIHRPVYGPVGSSYREPTPRCGSSDFRLFHIHELGLFLAVGADALQLLSLRVRRGRGT